MPSNRAALAFSGLFSPASFHLLTIGIPGSLHMPSCFYIKIGYIQLAGDELGEEQVAVLAEVENLVICRLE